MKKIIVRAGYHFELSAAYVKLSPSYDSLTKQQKLDFLDQIIDELAFEKSFIASDSSGDKPSGCQATAGLPLLSDVSS
jgi:hypothetical protein